MADKELNAKRMAALAKARATKRTAKPTRRSGAILSRRREPHEIPTPRAAMRNFCIECMGYQPTEVKYCTSPQCWLFPYRLGAGSPPERSLRVIQEQASHTQNHELSHPSD